MVDHYVIATWPDGMQLVRPVSLEPGGMMTKVLRAVRKEPAYEAFAIEMKADRLIMWALLDPTGHPVIFLAIRPAMLTLPRRQRLDWLIEVRIGTIDGVMMPVSARDAVVWVVSSVLRESSESIEIPTKIPMPEQAEQFTVGAIGRSVAAQHKAMKGQRKMRILLSYSSTAQLISALYSSNGSKEWHSSGSLRLFRGTFGVAGESFQVEVRFPDVDEDTETSWAIHDANWHPERTHQGRAYTSLSTERSTHNGLLATSNTGFYDALKKAGLLVLPEDYDDWVENNSNPGTLSSGFSMYQMLGIPIPATFVQSEWVAWIEGLES